MLVLVLVSRNWPPPSQQSGSHVPVTEWRRLMSVPPITEQWKLSQIVKLSASAQ
jgi:hypothetical protein